MRPDPDPMGWEERRRLALGWLGVALLTVALTGLLYLVAQLFGLYGWPALLLACCAAARR